MTDDRVPPPRAPLAGVLPLDDATLSRRGFLSASAMAMIAATLAGCGDTSTAPRANLPLPAGVTVAGHLMTIDLAIQATLAATGGFLIIANAATNAYVIVLNLGGNTYRAFTSICTHEGCIVSSFSGTTITCNCHGSQFNTNGQVVVGPAASGLAQFTTAFNTGPNTVTVTF